MHRMGKKLAVMSAKRRAVGKRAEHREEASGAAAREES